MHSTSTRGSLVCGFGAQKEWQTIKKMNLFNLNVWGKIGATCRPSPPPSRLCLRLWPECEFVDGPRRRHHGSSSPGEGWSWWTGRETPAYDVKAAQTRTRTHGQQRGGRPARRTLPPRASRTARFPRHSDVCLCFLNLYLAAEPTEPTREEEEADAEEGAELDVTCAALGGRAGRT